VGGNVSFKEPFDQFSAGDYVFGVYAVANTELHSLKTQGGQFILDNESEALDKALEKSYYDAAGSNTSHNKNKRKSKVAIYVLVNKSRKIHFVLDLLNIDEVIHKNHAAETQANRSITSAELRWIYKNRDNVMLRANIQFWYQGVQCLPPWVDGSPRYSKKWGDFKPSATGKQIVDISEIYLHDEATPVDRKAHTREGRRQAK
jgi:hypothetical protein